MAKKIMFLLFSGLLSFALMGCESSDDGAGGNSQMTAEVYTAVAAAMSTAQSSASRGSTAINYSGNGWTATGTCSFDDTNIYPYVYDIDFTWDGYTSGSVILVSGTASCYLNMPSASSMTYAYDGTFVVLYGGVEYDYSWDIDVTSDGSSYSITGEYTVDGATYSYSNNINY